MSLSHKHIGLKVLAKIKIYILSRAKLLITVWDEIPCNQSSHFGSLKKLCVDLIKINLHYLVCVCVCLFRWERLHQRMNDFPYWDFAWKLWVFLLTIERQWFCLKKQKSTYEKTQMSKLHCWYQDQLKYGFCKKSLRKDEPLTSWTLFWAFLSSHLGGFAVGATANPPKSDDKYAQKSVQLVRGSSFQSDFLQNLYFNTQ